MQINFRVLLLLAFQSFVLSSGSSSSHRYHEMALIGDWPSPVARYRYFRASPRRRNRLIGRREPVDNIFSFIGSCLFPLFYGAQPIHAPQSLPEITETELKEGQKSCEVCFNAVDLTDCHQCCKNGHLLHSRCFSRILNSDNENSHKCPLCRERLFSNPEQIQKRIKFTSPDDSTWNALVGHIHILQLIKPVEMNLLDWNGVFFHIVTKGRPEHLRNFLILNLIDVNVSFYETRSNYCAIAALLIGLHLHKDDPRCVDRLRQNLNILLDHPKIILNRMDGNIESPRHLIYHTIDSNNFDVFLQILDAAPGINLAEIFRYVCMVPNREVIFNYLLTCKTFDLFTPDINGCSALHIAVRNGQTYYALALLESPEVKTDNLLSVDKRDGRTVFHTAMVFSLDEIVDKLIAFPDVNWDLQDSSGRSIHSLYMARMNEHY